MRNRMQILSGIGFLLGFCALTVAYGLEYFLQLEPCPLCLLSRFVVFLLSAVFLISFIFSLNSWRLWLNTIIGITLSLIGLLISGRHLWLQSLPPESTPACGPSLMYLLKSLPFHEALAHVFIGSGECAKIQANWFGLTLPGWTAVLMGGFLIISILIVRASLKKG